MRPALKGVPYVWQGWCPGGEAHKRRKQMAAKKATKRLKKVKVLKKVLPLGGTRGS